MADIAAWWLCAIRHLARDLWDSLPGPWWVKVMILVACQAIPGQLDELLIIAIVAWWRRRKGGEGMGRYAGEWSNEPEDSCYPADPDAEDENEMEAGD